jgi:aldehyde:ferredoxin oxidoreductase
LAEYFGHPEIAMHSKHLELPAYDPRGFHGMAIALATNNRGGCHLRGYLVGPEALGNPILIDRFTSRGKPGLAILFQNLTATIDSFCNCLFTNFALNPDLYAKMLSGVTGQDVDGKALLKIGERIWNIEKLFNLREGFTREDDTLPKRLLEEPFKCGHSKDKKIELQPMLDEYYALRGWSVEGIPSQKKLAELGLSVDFKA